MVFTQIAIASSMAYQQELFNLASELNEQGIVFADNSQFEEALECFKRADEILPGNAQIRKNIQICLENMK